MGSKKKQTKALAPFDAKMFSWLAKFEKKINDNLLIKTHKELLQSENDNVRLNALRLAYEVTGKMNHQVPSNAGSKKDVVDVLKATTKLIGEIKDAFGDRNLQPNRNPTASGEDGKGVDVIEGEVVESDEGTKEKS